jgi:hypothetical protein
MGGLKIMSETIQFVDFSSNRFGAGKYSLTIADEFRNWQRIQLFKSQLPPTQNFFSSCPATHPLCGIGLPH